MINKLAHIIQPNIFEIIIVTEKCLCMYIYRERVGGGGKGRGRGEKLRETLTDCGDRK